MKAEIKSIKNIISANIFIMIIGIMQTLLLPTILGPSEYGYWSFYLLCIGYACFVVLGFCDGFYLEHGGERYDEINKKYFSSLHFLMICYLAVVLVIWTICIFLFVHDVNDSKILLIVGISGVLACEVSFFVMLSQAVARFNLYAKGNIIEKSALLIATLIFLIFHTGNALWIVITSVIGKIITVLYYLWNSKDIIKLKPKVDIQLLKSGMGNIKSGFPLALSAVCAGLVTGIGRFTIKGNLGIEELGYYSLAFSITAIFTQIIAAIAIVFFPLFCRITIEKTKLYLTDIEYVISLIGIMLMIFYYPGYLLIQKLFPNYLQSLGCILYLIPIVICQARISIVYNTIYKVYRMEKQMVFNVIIAVAFCFVATLITFYIIPTKETVMCITYVSYVSWCFVTVAILNKKMKIKMSLISSDIIASTFFIVINWLLGFTWISFIVSLVLIVIIILFNNKKLIGSYRNVKKIIMST